MQPQEPPCEAWEAYKANSSSDLKDLESANG